MIKEALFYEKLEGKAARCYLCAHQCRIAPSKLGICKARKNIDGVLNTLYYGQLAAANIDPIEKKPLYHFLPGTSSYSIAAAGCNFKCGFCQNWELSQEWGQRTFFKKSPLSPVMPEEIVRRALVLGAKSISYTYTEPTIFFEYSYDTAVLAKAQGLKNVFVTNGYMSPQALETISPYLAAANVDLKSFREDFYAKNCKARLRPVLDTIKLMKELNIWIEITTLVIPGANDSYDELKGIAEFIAGISKSIPWHVSRFYPAYKFTDYKPTPVETLNKAKKIGESAGLRYVYLGNVMEGADTYCYACKKVLIKRTHFSITENNVKSNSCPFCAAEIEGVF